MRSCIHKHLRTHSRTRTGTRILRRVSGKKILVCISSLSSSFEFLFQAQESTRKETSSFWLKSPAHFDNIGEARRIDHFRDIGCWCYACRREKVNEIEALRFNGEKSISLANSHKISSERKIVRIRWKFSDASQRFVKHRFLEVYIAVGVTLVDVFQGSLLDSTGSEWVNLWQFESIWHEPMSSSATALLCNRNVFVL